MHTMSRRNNTNVAYFLLMGLTDSEGIRVVLFCLFLLVYLITVLGNAGMILLIRLDRQLHTPMYFFLSHLSFLDLIFSTIITPQTLENLLTSNKYISFGSCFTQMFFFIFSIVTECYLLCSMACDRYVAICNPLQYPVVMCSALCQSFVTASYVIGFSESFAIVIAMNTMHFCDSNVIHHFFCDTTPVLVLGRAKTRAIEIMISTLAGCNVMVPVIAISVSYVSILFTILKISSSSGKRKTFSTCASHLMGVSIFFGSVSFTYVKPSKSYSLGKDQVASVFYTIVIPMLNPLIYSLRNKEVKNAIIRITQWRKKHHLR